MKMVSDADSEAKFRAIFNNVQDAIILLDKEVFYDCNKKAEKIFGYEKKHLLGKSLFSFFPKKQPLGKLSGPLAKQFIKKALNGNHMVFEWAFKTKKREFEVEVKLNSIIVDGKKIILAVLRDITKRLEYMHRLKEEEVRFDLITKSTGQLFYDYEIKSGKIKWEGAIEHITGHSEFNAGISQWAKRIHPEERKGIISEVKKSLLSHKPYSMEYRFRKKDGSYLWIRDTRCFTVIEGKASMLGTMQDITNEKNYLRELELSKKNVQSILDNTIDMITIIDYLGKIIYVTPSVKKWLGYDASELIGKRVFDFLHKEDLLFSRGLLKEVLINPTKEKHFNIRFRHKNGTFSYLEASGKNIGRKIIVNSKDITEKKKTHGEMTKLSAVVEQGADVVIITDIKGNIEYVNRKFSEVTGYRAKEVIGKNPRILKSEKTKKEEYKQLWETILSGNPWHGEFQNRKKDGNYYWALVTITPIRDDDGKIINFVGVQEDITEIKLAEETIQKREEMNREVLNNLNIGIAINTIDDGKAVYFNDRFLDIYGWPKEDLADVDTFFKKVYPDAVYRKEIKARVMADMASGDASRMRWNGIKIRAKNGEDMFVNAYNIPLIKQNLMVSCVEDVTSSVKLDADKDLLNQELVQKLSDLERLQKLSVGRELRMIELKNRIKELEEKHSGEVKNEIKKEN